MLQVTDKYIESMKSPLRERSFLKVTLEYEDKSGAPQKLIYDSSTNAETKILRSNYTSSLSPICAELPQDDFSLTVDNKDGTFDIENPESIENFLTQGSKMVVEYGYEVPSTVETTNEMLYAEEQALSIEWMTPKTLYLMDWKSNDKTATLNVTDPLRFATGEFIPSKTHYDDIGELLQEIINKNNASGNPKITLKFFPIVFGSNIQKQPVDPHFPEGINSREALQMVANAFNYYIEIKYESQGTNKGDCQLVIRSISDDVYNEPVFVVNDGIGSDRDYQINKKNKVHHYPRNAEKWTRVDGSAMFPPENGESIGYEGFTGVSELMWDNMVMNAQECSGIRLEIATDKLPSRCKLRYTRLLIDYATGQVTREQGNEEIPITSHAQTIALDRSYYEVVSLAFDTNIARTTEKDVSISRAFLLNREDAEITKNDMLQYPVANKEELVKNITVSYYTYPPDGGEATESVVNKPVNNLGTRNINWKNPLITSKSMALQVAYKLFDHYKDNVFYDIDTRGNPELEAGDVILQANNFASNFETRLVEQSLNFDTSLRGSVITKRIGGDR